MKKLRLLASDWLRYNPTTRRMMSSMLYLRDLADGGEDANAVGRSLARLTQAARGRIRAPQPASLERRIIERTSQWQPEGFDWSAFFPHSEPRVVHKALILKAPQPNGEKGVLFIAFEDNWLRLLRYGDLVALERDYELILSPTWSPPHDLPMLLAARMWPGNLFTILSNLADEPIFRKLSPNLHAIPLLASSWVNPVTFAPNGRRARTHDIFVLANFAPYKRHFALFRTMQQMRPGITAVLVGRAWDGGTRKTLEEQARMFGVLKQVTIVEGPDDQEMVRLLHGSRASVIMSMGEGSCVAVAESLIADVPVGLIATANIGSAAFINEATGRLLRPTHMAEDLTALIDGHERFQPRKWMLDHGQSCEGSSQRLNSIMRDWAARAGYPWTRDLVPMQWRPNACYMTPADANCMEPEYVRFEKAYGVAIQFPRLPS